MTRQSVEDAFPPQAEGQGRCAYRRPGSSWVALFWLIPVGLALAFFVGRQNALASQPTKVCDLHFSNEVTIEGVPVAETREQQARGLSGVENVGQGMLFVWPVAEPRVFWMRDTRVPLTIGFFDEAGLLFGIQDMKPETDDYHFSIKPAVQALELAQGQFQGYGLKEGVRLIGQTCKRL